MPSTLIEVRRAYSQSEELALIDAVQQALREAFQLPESDRTVRLVTHEPHRFACSPRIADPDRFTLVTVDCFAGRSLAAKRALYQAIVTKLEPLGVSRESVKILLRESAQENWGIRGGQAACDVALGFNVNV